MCRRHKVWSAVRDVREGDDGSVDWPERRDCRAERDHWSERRGGTGGRCCGGGYAIGGGASAGSAAGGASASTIGEGADARSAAGGASASTIGKGADARSAAGGIVSLGSTHFCSEEACISSSRCKGFSASPLFEVSLVQTHCRAFNSPDPGRSHTDQVARCANQNRSIGLCECCSAGALAGRGGAVLV